MKLYSKWPALLILVSVSIIGCKPKNVRDVSHSNGNSIESVEPQKNMAAKTLLDVETLAKQKISKVFERPLSANITVNNVSGDYALVCGTPLETNGMPVDLKNSPFASQAADGLVDNRFCALFKVSGQDHELLEFDYGSTDSPLAGWYEYYDLPVELLKFESSK